MDHISRAVSGAAALGNGVLTRAGDAASRSALAALDALLGSRFSAEVVDRVLASELAERALRQALEGQLVDAAAEEVARRRLAEQLIDSPAAERVVARVIEGPLLDEAVARLLESEDLWLLVDEIARSPAVTDAIGRQSLGFADQVAGVVRTRSLNADERLERAVRGLVRRRRHRPAPSARPSEER